MQPGPDGAAARLLLRRHPGHRAVSASPSTSPGCSSPSSTARVTPLIPARFNPETYLPFAIPGLGLVIVVVVADRDRRLDRRLLRPPAHPASSTPALARMPVIRNIYSARQADHRDGAGAEVGRLPRGGAGRVSARAGCGPSASSPASPRARCSSVTRQDVINVFVPTTPNPTSGFLLFVPRARRHPAGDVGRGRAEDGRLRRHRHAAGARAAALLAPPVAEARGGSIGQACACSRMNGRPAQPERRLRTAASRSNR